MRPVIFLKGNIMDNETPVEETTSRIKKINAKLKQLPWKQIALGTAAFAAGVAVVKLTQQLSEPVYDLEITEVTPDGETHVEMHAVKD
jgi:hypothetical protein